MTLYAQYILEREGKEIIETDKGFATYSFNNGECYLQDIYVVPEFRKMGIMRQITEQVINKAKEKGCTYILGSVAVNAKNSSHSLRTLLNYDYKLYVVNSSMIFLKKDI